jgi:hypothetical protein
MDINRTGKSSGSDIGQVINLANVFKATLNDQQIQLLQLPYSKSDATKWSNLPATFRVAARLGISFGSLTAKQIEAAKALLKEIAGIKKDEGWDELQQLLNADDYLKTKGGEKDYGAEYYYIAFLGTPEATGKFEIQFGGHHLAFANTYKDGILVGATPSFRGVEPFGTFTINDMSNQPMNQEQEAFAALLKSLSEQELATAKLNSTFSDIVIGPRKDGAFPSNPSGIKCSGLSATQKKLVLAAIKTYVDDIKEPDAAKIMKKYTVELDNSYISYAGTTSMTTRNDYVRIDGPSIWIEYSCQGGIILPGTHPHSVWRDKTDDYGGTE